MRIKHRLMNLLRRNCSNCKWCDVNLKHCNCPVEYFNPFEGIKTQSINAWCISIVGEKDCKWRRKNDYRH